MCVAVPWLAGPYTRAAGQVVVLVSVGAGRDPFQHRLEVPQKEGFVFVYRQPQRRVQRLKVELPVAQAGGADRVLEPSGDVHEFGGTRGWNVEPQC